AHFWTSTTTAGRMCCSSTRCHGRRGRARRRIPRSTGTITTARLPTSHARRGWRCRCTASASPPPIHTEPGTPPPNSRPSDTTKSGLYDPSGKALGVALIDVDADGWPDVFVANDTQPNKLYRNRHDGTFVDQGMTAGVAFNEAGVARAGMGVDAADYDGSGRQAIIIGNFSNEMMALYANEGNGLFIDEAPSSTIGQASLLTLTFGCFFFDADLDGLLDIFAADGHVSDAINNVQPKVTYAQPAHLFRNLGAKKFEDISTKSGTALQQRAVARGAAYGDIDNDGDLDLLITTNNGPARLLRNDGGNRNHMLRVKTIGTESNRDGIGAKVRVT